MHDRKPHEASSESMPVQIKLFNNKLAERHVRKPAPTLSTSGRSSTTVRKDIKRLMLRGASTMRGKWCTEFGKGPGRDIGIGRRTEVIVDKADFAVA